jgi:hypothetical protein
VSGTWPLVSGLQHAAIELACYGWPVLRGTYFDGTGWRGRSGAVDLSPVDENWQSAWTREATQAATWWSVEPFSLLVACGHGVDCLQMPVSMGPRVLSVLRAAGVWPPAMLGPVGTVVWFVATDPGPRPFLVSASLRSVGSWVAVPPTGYYPGAGRSRGYRWVAGAAPGDVRGWELSERGRVYEVISAAVSDMASAPGMTPKRAL